jgi:hypothetical protein
MDGSIELTADERKMLLKSYRSGTDARCARRAHIVLLRAAGWTWDRIRVLPLPLVVCLPVAAAQRVGLEGQRGDRPPRTSPAGLRVAPAASGRRAD